MVRVMVRVRVRVRTIISEHTMSLTYEKTGREDSVRILFRTLPYCNLLSKMG